MTDIEYKHRDMIDQLTKDPHVILSELIPLDVDLIHCGMGVCGEAGELLDAIKKPSIYRKEYDRENIIEELGDLEFYTGRIRRTLGISREDVLVANMAKLQKRYPGYCYTDRDAHHRADKNEPAPVL